MARKPSPDDLGGGALPFTLSETQVIQLLLSCGPPVPSLEYTLKFVKARERLEISGHDLPFERWAYQYKTYRRVFGWMEEFDRDMLERVAKEKGIAAPLLSQPVNEEKT